MNHQYLMNLIHSSFGELLLRNDKWSSKKSLRFWNSISFQFRNSAGFTKPLTILLPFMEWWNSENGVPQTWNRGPSFYLIILIKQRSRYIKFFMIFYLIDYTLKIQLDQVIKHNKSLHVTVFKVLYQRSERSTVHLN